MPYPARTRDATQARKRADSGAPAWFHCRIMTPTLITLAALAIVALTLAALWRWHRPVWLGFEGRTLWDWLSLLAVPLVVGFATVLINAGQQQLANERAAEAALQQYVDRISALVLAPPTGPGAETRVTAIGRAQTLAVLRLTDRDRAGRVLAFLADMEMLARFAISLEGMRLDGAELKGLALTGMDFENASLRGADLEGAKLAGADFEGADLTRADFKGADLRGADFFAARLSGSEFDGADLRGALLAGASGLSARQLARACMDATTTLPAGFTPLTGQSPGCALDPAEIDDD